MLLEHHKTTTKACIPLPTHRFGPVTVLVAPLTQELDNNNGLFIVSAAIDVCLHWLLLQHHPIAEDFGQTDGTGARSNHEKQKCC